MRPGARRAIVPWLAAFLVGACSPVEPSAAPPASGLLSGIPSVAASPAATPDRSAAPSGPLADVALQLLFDDLVSPLALVVPPGDDDRVFVVEQTGRISILVGGERLPSPFLDLSDRLVRLDTEYDERGLLGLAFHPDFAANGRFFVYYSTPPPADAPEPVDHTDRLSEFRVGLDADAADPESERVVLEFEQPQSNHPPPAAASALDWASAARAFRSMRYANSVRGSMCMRCSRPSDGPIQARRRPPRSYSPRRQGSIRLKQKPCHRPRTAGASSFRPLTSLRTRGNRPMFGCPRHM